MSDKDDQFEQERRECLDILMEYDRIDANLSEAVSGLEYVPYQHFHEMRENHFTDEMIAHAFSIPVSDVEETIQALDKYKDSLLSSISRQQAFCKRTGQAPTSREALKHYGIVKSSGFSNDEPDYLLIDKLSEF